MDFTKFSVRMSARGEVARKTGVDLLMYYSTESIERLYSGQGTWLVAYEMSFIFLTLV